LGIISFHFDVIKYWSDILRSSDTGENGSIKGQYLSYLRFSGRRMTHCIWYTHETSQDTYLNAIHSKVSISKNLSDAFQIQNGLKH